MTSLKWLPRRLSGGKQTIIYLQTKKQFHSDHNETTGDGASEFSMLAGLLTA